MLVCWLSIIISLLQIFSISASNLEFVLNDGDCEWDKPSYEANYFIGSPGSYILKKGKLEKVR